MTHQVIHALLVDYMALLTMASHQVVHALLVDYMALLTMASHQVIHALLVDFRLPRTALARYHERLVRPSLPHLHVGKGEGVLTMAVRTNPTLTTDLHVGSGEVVDKVHLLWPHAYHGHTCHGHTYYRPACMLPPP